MAFMDLMSALLVVSHAGAPPSEPERCRAAVAEAQALLAAVEADPDSYENLAETLATLRAAAEAPCPEALVVPAPAPEPAPKTDKHRTGAPSFSHRQDVVATAMRLLAASPSGAQLAATLRIYHVTIRIEPRLPQELIAAFETKTGELLLSPGTLNRTAASVAAAIAHEAHHAAQIYSGAFQPSIEAEVDATVAHHIFLHELLLSQKVSLADLAEQRLDHMRFRDAVRNDGLARFEEMIARRYRDQRGKQLAVLRSRAGPRWGWFARWAAEFYDSDELRPFETLRHQKKLINLERWGLLARARATADRRREWRERWATEHRLEFGGR